MFVLSTQTALNRVQVAKYKFNKEVVAFILFCYLIPLTWKA